jgi:tRNA-2-methylthio-N6-dimethylallyladenosine synthase
MIVGFPGETEADFEDTLSLTAAARFHSMFSFKYSPRPNTLARKRLVDDVPDPEKTARIVALQTLQRGIQTELHAAAIGSEVEVLVDSVSRRHVHELSGRSMTNTVVNFPRPSDTPDGALDTWIGRRVRVRVESAGPHSVRGRAI